MKCPHYILFFLFLISSVNYAQAQIYLFQPEQSTIISADKGVQLLDQASRDTPQYISSYFDLEDNDINNLENNFKKILQLQSTNCYLEGEQISNLRKYTYQYIGVIIDGDKYIYINAFDTELLIIFPTWIETWEKDPIAMYDGGEQYWGALFNLDKMAFSQLAFNAKIVSF